MKIETLAVQAGHAVDAGAGAVTHPLVLSTTFERAADGSLPHGYMYTRHGNPNRQSLEKYLAALEGGTEAAAFASGSAATMSVLHALSANDHLIAPRDVYHGTRLLIDSLYERWGLRATYVDMTNLTEVAQAVRPNTKLIWVETPSNPLLTITDIKRVVEMAHQQGARCVCDNTWATPIFQRPFDLGADLIMHSTTKYFGGHSDVLGGCIITKRSDDFFGLIRGFQTMGGAVPSPFDCWLLLRSIPTLPYRMKAHSENAQRVAAFLSQHPQVEKVHYPGLSTHPGYEIAAAQMSQPGGMLSIQVAGGREAAAEVIAKVKLFTRATSLGGYESLIEHRVLVEGPASTTPPNLLRISIGLENAEDLVADLAQALEGNK